MDKAKVINSLERCARLQDSPMSHECADCAYRDKSIGTCFSLSTLMNDAADLLKDQTTTWVEEKDRYYHWHCEKCGFVEGAPAMTHKYCPNCGRKVMRDE